MLRSNLFRAFYAPDGTGTGGEADPPAKETEPKPFINPPGKKGEQKEPTSDNRSKEEILAELLKTREEKVHLHKVHEEMKKKAEKQAKAEEEAKKKALEEQGKFKELYEADHNELEKLKARTVEMEAALKAYYDAEIESIPDNIKSLISEKDPVEKRLTTLAGFKKAGLLTDKKKPGDGSPAAKGGKKLSLADIYK